MDKQTVRYVLVREGEHRWKHVLGIADERIYVFELQPAWTGGWVYKKLSIQDKEGWPNMNADEIWAWKQKNATSLDCYVDPKPSDIEWLREELAKVNAVLSLS